MKALFFTLLLAAFVAPGLHAQNVTAKERAKAVKYLEKTRNEILAATKGLSEAQWKYKAAPDKWSIAEVAEHIAAAEDFISEMIHEKVMNAPARKEAADLAELDDLVITKVPDRSHKVQAPEPLKPSNRFGSPKESLMHFRESRAKTILFVKKTEGLRQHAMENPMGKVLDGYQWALFVGAHSERHFHQIEEVKQSPGFPKK